MTGKIKSLDDIEVPPGHRLVPFVIRRVASDRANMDPSEAIDGISLRKTWFWDWVEEEVLYENLQFIRNPHDAP